MFTPGVNDPDQREPKKEHTVRHILEIAKSLPHDYTTRTEAETSTDLSVGSEYARTYADALSVRYESDGRTLHIGTEIGVTMPDGADPDVDEGAEDVIGYTWSVYNSDEEGTEPILTDGTDSEATAIATIADFMDQTS